MYTLSRKLFFPPVEMADPDGLLAIGGDLSVDRLLLAYRSGIFTWNDDHNNLWWSPDPRFVLFPNDLKISKGVKPLLNRNEFEFTTNKAFRKVIRHCKEIKRSNQHGTWITDSVERAFNKLHKLGHAHSAEVWKDGKLVGGLYGLRMGKVFFGESMFSLQSNASRYAFIKYVELLKQEGVQLIDCQVHSDYLESFGAKMILRREFMRLLEELI